MEQRIIKKKKFLFNDMIDAKGHKITKNSVIVDYDTKETFYVYSKNVIVSVLSNKVYSYDYLEKRRYLKVYHKPSFLKDYQQKWGKIKLKGLCYNDKEY